MVRNLWRTADPMSVKSVWACERNKARLEEGLLCCASATTISSSTPTARNYPPTDHQYEQVRARARQVRVPDGPNPTLGCIGARSFGEQVGGGGLRAAAKGWQRDEFNQTCAHFALSFSFFRFFFLQLTGKNRAQGEGSAIGATQFDVAQSAVAQTKTTYNSSGAGCEGAGRGSFVDLV